MQTATQTPPPSTRTLWTARIMIGIATLFLLFDGVIHVLAIEPVVESFAQLGYPARLALSLGVIELFCLVLFVVPRTSLLGAILLTGYLGGAIAANVRIGSPLFSHVLFPVYLGVLIWGALLLRDRQLRALVPVRR